MNAVSSAEEFVDSLPLDKDGLYIPDLIVALRKRDDEMLREAVEAVRFFHDVCGTACVTGLEDKRRRAKIEMRLLRQVEARLLGKCHVCAGMEGKCSRCTDVEKIGK